MIFDLDGVLVDSERLWDDARRQLVRERGLTWRPEATRAMMGMSSLEWSQYLHEELQVDLSPREISDDVTGRLRRSYRERLPLIDGAAEAVEALAKRWALGLASSSNRELIDLVLEGAHVETLFAATVSSEEVAQGKPSPDVYLEAARRLDVEPARCVAVEDSASGLRAAAAAEMTVVAIPNPHFPPDADALRAAACVIASLQELRPPLLDRLTSRP